MSFPRAKIHRFNEATGSTPAPGSYNPKFDDKIIGIGAVIEKSQRFVEIKNKAAGSSDVLNTSFTSGKPKATSLTHLPVFRTPQVPQRLKVPASNSKLSSPDSLNVRTLLRSESLKCLRAAPNSKEDSILELEYLVNQLNGALRDKEEELVKMKADRDEETSQLKDKIFGISHRLTACETLYTAQLAKQQIFFDQAENALQEQNSRVEYLDSKLVLAEANFHSLTTQLTELNLTLSDLKETQQTLHNQIGEFESLLVEKDNLIEVLQTIPHEEDQTLTAINDSVSASSDATQLWTDLAQQTESVRKEVLCLDSRNMELELENQKLSTKCHEDTLIRDRLCAKIDALLDEQDIRESVNLELEKQVSILEKMDAVQKAQIIHLEEERNELDYEARNVSQITDHKIADLNRHISSLTETDTEQKSLLFVTKQDVLALEDKLKECKDNMAKMEEDFQEVDQERQGTIAHMAQLLVEFNDVVSDLKHKVAEKQEMILMLQGELSEKEVQLEEMSADCLRVTQLENDTDGLQAELSKCSQKIDDMKSSQVQNIVANDEKQKILEDNILNGSILREGLESTLHSKQVELENLKERYDSLRLDSEAKLEKHEMEADSKQNEIIFELLETHAKLRLAECELEEVQSLLAKTKLDCEANIETLMAEKTALTLNRDELRVSNIEYQLSIVDLQDKVDVLTVELNASVKYHRDEVERFSKELKASREQCRRFEIGNANLHASLEAVTVRLMETIRDSQAQEELIVELNKRYAYLETTLKEQMECTEESLAALEVKNLQEINEVGLLLCSKTERLVDEMNATRLEYQEHLKTLPDKYEMLVTDMGAMYNGLEQKFNEVVRLHSTLQQGFKEQGKELYETKFDLLLVEDELNSEKKNAAILEEKLNSLSSCHKNDDDFYTNNLKTILLEMTDCTVGELPDDIQDAIVMLSAAVANCRKTKDLADELARQNKCAQELQTQLNEERDRTLSQVIAENNTKDCQLQELKLALQASIEENEATKSAEWEKRYHQLASLVGPFREQLEEFEAERDVLESRKEAADNEVKDLAIKYAQILGHQNHKQKIHHVVKLKELNLELKQDLEKAEHDVRAKDKTIKKLKSEVAALTRKPLPSGKSHLSTASMAKGKENSDHSPARQSPNPKPFRELANC